MIKDIIEKPINDLIFADYNPRQLSEDEYKNLKESIEKFGLVDPIIINKNKKRENIIIGGHQRVKVARTMNIKKVPCVELDLTLEQERELNIRLNKNTGTWDWDILANMFDVDELLEWGFKDFELKIDYKETLDKMAEWEGMPEFDNENLEAFKQIRVSFKDEDSIKAFAKLVGQKITEKTKNIWYPKEEINVVKHKQYIDGEQIES